MSGMEWLESLALSSAFLPYTKTAAKWVLSHSASLSLGLVAFLTSQTLKGEATMKTTEKKMDWVDYVTAHPFFLPLWVWVFGWMVQTLGIGLYWLIPLLFFAVWFYSYLDSAPRLFAYYSRNHEEKEMLPCIQSANT
jgi:predicted Na+-dependent transporter